MRDFLITDKVYMECMHAWDVRYKIQAGRTSMTITPRLADASVLRSFARILLLLLLSLGVLIMGNHFPQPMLERIKSGQISYFFLEKTN